MKAKEISAGVNARAAAVEVKLRRLRAEIEKHRYAVHVDGSTEYRLDRQMKVFISIRVLDFIARDIRGTENSDVITIYGIPCEVFHFDSDEIWLAVEIK